MPLFFLGTREWRNRQTRTVQVRVPVMEWGFNSPLAHDETADPFGICGFCFPWLLLVDPRVFRAPEGPAAVCAGGRWPASLMVLLVAPRVFRAPEGPAAREARASLRSAPRLEARPCPPVPPAPSTPVGPGVLMCGLVRRVEARPGPVSRSVPYPQFRMQFPDTCSSSLSEKPGISTITFQSMKCMWGNCMRVFWGSGHIDTCWWRSRNPRARWAGCLKSPSPLLARARVGLKPLSPLRARNGCFWCSFPAQR